MDQKAHSPAFIIGCPRSGTTLLRLMLDSHSHLSAGPETNFLEGFEPILKEQWARIELYGFPEKYWLEKVAQFYSSFQLEYAERRGKRRWVAKTPHYTMHLDFIDKLFPASQMIHLIRDGRSVVGSFRERWGYRAALRGIDVWRGHVEAAREFGRRVSEDRYLEVRYEDLVSKTESAIRDVLEFLGEPWENRVLDYSAQPHDVEARYELYTNSRRQRAGDDRLIYRSRISGRDCRLDPLLRLLFRLRSGALLRDLGYG